MLRESLFSMWALRHADTMFVFATVAAAPSTNSSQDADDSNGELCTGLTQICEVVDRQNTRVADFDADLW